MNFRFAMLGALALLAAPAAFARPHAVAEAALPTPATQVVELLVLHATHQKRGIAPELRGLPELTKTPFSAYDSYALLERERLTLAEGTPKTHRLPNGRVLGTELVELKQGGIVRLRATISEPGGHAFLPLLEVRATAGQHFIVAGQSYRGGILVLVVTLAG
jgi:hypothetical protein